MITKRLSLLLLCRAAVAFVFLLPPGVDGADSGDSCNTTCDYTAWALDANCRGYGLKTVPAECRFSEIMDLRNNQLESLEAGAFQGYAALRYLDLEFNAIQDIAEGAFEGCSALGFIYLQYNTLQRVNRGAFRGADILKWLFLNQNEITYVHPDGFQGLARLERLYLADNNIHSLNESVFRHTLRLQYLHIGSNSLADLPPAILDPLTSLTYLNLEENRLHSLDGRLFQRLTSLVELALAGNQLQAISHVPELPWLSVLDLSWNALGDLTALDRGVVEELSVLYLGGNANVECSCSAAPVQDWLLAHTSEADMEDARLNVSCSLPERFHGQRLRSIDRASLCSERMEVAPLPPLPEAARLPSAEKPMPTAKKPLVGQGKHHEGQTGGSDSNPALDAGGVWLIPEEQHTLVYVVVGGATLLVVVFALLLVLHCMKSKTRSYYNRTPVNRKPRRRSPSKPRPAPPHPQLPPEPRPHPTDDEDPEDGIYEPVGGRDEAQRRQHIDSAFSSLEDMTREGFEAEEPRGDGAAGVPPMDPSREPSQGYMSMEVLRAMQQASPAHGPGGDHNEGAPLAAGRPDGGPGADTTSPYPFLILNEEQTSLLAGNAVLVPLSALPQGVALRAALALPPAKPRPHPSYSPPRRFLPRCAKPYTSCTYTSPTTDEEPQCTTQFMA